MNKKYCIGIDLHGTLLNESWNIDTQSIPALIEALSSLKNDCAIYVCSGNDLTFIYDYVPEVVRACFDGYILETGCTFSDGITEKNIVPETIVQEIKELEQKLKDRTIPEIKYFGRRLTTISMFTRNEHDGIDPDEIFGSVKKIIDDLGYGNKVLVTHSSVAIDIIPVGYNKFTGMQHVAGDSKTIGIADSLNDYHMILYADYSFIPANASPKLLTLLQEKNGAINTISNHDNAPTLRSNKPFTEGVIDALHYIKENLV